MLWDLDDLAGTSELAAEYMVGLPTISNWAARYPDFPAPLTHIGRRPVYSRKQVGVWWAAKNWFEWQQRQGKQLS